MAHLRWDEETKKWINLDESYKDPNSGLNGPVYCPENGYFDPVLNKRFETKRQKREYMRANGLKMHGSNSPKKIEGTGRKTLYFFNS